MVQILTKMDNNTEFPIEMLGRGSYVNSNAFLIEDRLDSIARCEQRCTIFTINKNKFYSILKKYPAMFMKVRKYIQETFMQKDNPIVLDYMPGHIKINHKGKILKGVQAKKAQKLLLNLKNAIMYLVVQNREKRKIPNLGQILAAAIAQQKLEKQAARA